MAARTTRTNLNESWKEKIKLAQLINRLNDCAMGEVEMTSQQLKATEILLKKIIPDLKGVDLSAELSGKVEIQAITRKIIDPTDGN